jgi:hypothetical protein
MKKRLLFVGAGLRAEWLFCDCGHGFSEHSGDNNEKCSGCAQTQTGDIPKECRAGGFTNGLIREIILRARLRLPAVAA